MCHPEPGPELDSGSNEFRVSCLIDFSEMLKQVQHDISDDFSFATQSPRERGA